MAMKDPTFAAGSIRSVCCRWISFFSHMQLLLSRLSFFATMLFYCRCRHASLASEVSLSQQTSTLGLLICSLCPDQYADSKSMLHIEILTRPSRCFRESKLRGVLPESWQVPHLQWAAAAFQPAYCRVSRDAIPCNASKVAVCSILASRG